ncbi:MAG: hypothetical protein RDV48_14320 [Candidatus Eremiobacteraeota bacterium]|nr:hypothetical protein [Candidatus Eremiobacteraeota bacterium]
MNKYAIVSRIVLIVVIVLFIFGGIYSYLGLDVPSLYKTGKSVRDGSYRHGHHHHGRSGFHSFSGGGLHGGK